MQMKHFSAAWVLSKKIKWTHTYTPSSNNGIFISAAEREKGNIILRKTSRMQRMGNGLKARNKPYISMRQGLFTQKPKYVPVMGVRTYISLEIRKQENTAQKRMISFEKDVLSS